MESAGSRLCLGVARLGSAHRGERAAAETFAAVALAADAGVRLLEGPSDAEAVWDRLGETLPTTPAFRITVRLAAADETVDVGERIASILRRLGRERLDAVLTSAGAIDRSPALWTALGRLKDRGLVERLGISACVCDAPADLARHLRPDVMQLPLNLLDQRLLADGTLDRVKAKGAEVRLRSVFVNGLLFDGGAASAPLPPHVSRARRILAEAGADPMQSALAFALSQPAADHVVVSVGGAKELGVMLRAASAPSPSLDWAALRAETVCDLAPRRCAAA